MIASFISGCSKNIPNMEQRLNTVDILTPKNYKKHLIKTSSYTFFAISNISNQCKSINIYIEGDGLAWITRTRVSSSPTPLNPVGLKLMLKDDSKCKLYIARPCQYIKTKICSKKDWTSHRFSKKIINSTNEAINNIKKDYDNQSFTMTGFSGGGAIATILAAKRNDVKKLVTYAGNLDTKKWTKIHNISELNGSLNPSDYTKDLEGITQIHYVGRFDKIMPIEIFNTYRSKFKNNENIEVIILDLNHSNMSLNP